MKLKTKKHPEWKNTYIVKAYGKEFHVGHFLEDIGEFKGEWTIHENKNGNLEWVDTVFGKGYALQRIIEIYGG